jgi:polyhydroxyalkanoate synthesis regulator phasin
MSGNERIKKYLEAGTVFGQVTRARAEEIVRELVSAGDIQRGQAQEWVDNLVDRSRKTSEQVLELIRHEVSTQLSKIDSSAVENIAGQVADILKRSAEAGRSATSEATSQATKTAKAARKAAEKVVPTGRKKPSGKKTTAAKSATATKSTATKSTAKKATAPKKATTPKKTAATGGTNS